MTLTEEQKQALRDGVIVRITEPETQTECVLIRADVYQNGRKETVGVDEFEIPPGIRRAQQAFRRDLPALLETHYDQWALYHGDQRIAIAATDLELLEECRRRGFKADEICLGKIARYTLADLDGDVEIDPSFFEFDEIESGS